MMPPIPRNSCARWTEEMDQQLIALLKENNGLEFIAEECGRSTGAILARMEFIGIQVVRFAQLKKIIAENM